MGDRPGDGVGAEGQGGASLPQRGRSTGPERETVPPPWVQVLTLSINFRAPFLRE